MASIQKKGKSFYCQFCFQRKRYTLPIGKVTRGRAEAFAVEVEELLDLIHKGRISVPTNVSISDYVLSGGKALEPKPQQYNGTFQQIRDEYLKTHSIGSMEANSLYTAGVHLRHFERTLGASFSLTQLSRDDLQRHINRRATKKIRGRALSPSTIRKEIATLRAMWNWAVDGEALAGQFPARNLHYPKCDEKPPFQTRAEIERRIASRELTNRQKSELWACLYLKVDEIVEFLEYVKTNAAEPWVYPLVCTAAYTGARRSELLRMTRDDFDWEDQSLVIREKKRVRGKRTTRRVAVSSYLQSVLVQWLESHPASPFLFFDYSTDSAENGHTNLRNKTITIEPLTARHAYVEFRQTLSGSKWEVVRGFHTLRHSFISAMAAKGIDQRIIDDFVGHQTDEQRRRYRHLIPEVKQRAISLVFG